MIDILLATWVPSTRHLIEFRQILKAPTTFYSLTLSRFLSSANANLFAKGIPDLLNQSNPKRKRCCKGKFLKVVKLVFLLLDGYNSISEETQLNFKVDVLWISILRGQSGDLTHFLLSKSLRLHNLSWESENLSSIVIYNWIRLAIVLLVSGYDNDMNRITLISIIAMPSRWTR